ncbi:MAG: hypothetical protein ACRD51_13830 [Candidatus Acidiferrum sp.]
MFEASPRSSPASAVTDYIQPTLGHALRVWWAYFWPTTSISFLLGLLLAQVIRLLYENLIANAKPLVLVTKYASYVIHYIVAFFVLRYVLGKTFRGFRLSLVSDAGTSSSQVLKPTLERTLRVWWVFMWRTVLYGLLCFALVLYPMGMFVGIFNPSPLFANLFFLALGTAAGGAIALYVIYSNILDEDVGDFRVALLPRQMPAGAGDPLAAMPIGLAHENRPPSG